MGDRIQSEPVIGFDRNPHSAEKAAQQLKEEIDHSLFFHLLEYNYLGSSPGRRTSAGDSSGRPRPEPGRERDLEFAVARGREDLERRRPRAQVGRFARVALMFDRRSATRRCARPLHDLGEGSQDKSRDTLRVEFEHGEESLAIPR